MATHRSLVKRKPVFRVHVPFFGVIVIQLRKSRSEIDLWLIYWVVLRKLQIRSSLINNIQCTKNWKIITLVLFLGKSKHKLGKTSPCHFFIFLYKLFISVKKHLQPQSKVTYFSHLAVNNVFIALSP